jgi:hypothetical protein
VDPPLPAIPAIALAMEAEVPGDAPSSPRE